MDFLFQNCIVSAENFSSPMARKSLGYPHGMTSVLLNLQRLRAEMQKNDWKKVMGNYLSSREQEYFDKFTSDKRKKEWLGGRIAAKYVAAEILLQRGKVFPWPSLAVLADGHGRPFLAVDKKNGVMLDISISHSGGLAAAMAVSKGLCGIDIQKFSDRVLKVRERFCTPGEEYILRSNLANQTQTAVLSKLWAAKEALRKAAKTSSLPGFLDLELTEIHGDSSSENKDLRRFILIWKHIDINGNPTVKKCSVVVSLIADYALALTTRNDTVD